MLVIFKTRMRLTDLRCEQAKCRGQKRICKNPRTPKRNPGDHIGIQKFQIRSHGPRNPNKFSGQIDQTNAFFST